MPEYLAPDVYVEEIDTGSKPIEGVSTSTAGMVGVAERGPVNVPILITGLAEYARWFGQNLRRDDFSNPLGGHCYLPHAVEGFFANGGKRLYVTRVLDTAVAARSAGALFDRGDANPASTVLLRPAAEDTGSAANPPLAVTLPDANLAVNDWIRVGDGSDAEYRQVTQITTPDTVAVLLDLPIARGHGPVTVDQFTPAATIQSYTILVTAPATRTQRGDDTLEVLSGGAPALDAIDPAVTPPPAGGVLLRVSEAGMANIAEYRFMTRFARLAPTRARVTLDAPLLLDYASTSVVDYLNVTATVASANLDPSAPAAASLVFVGNRGVNLDVTTDLALIDGGTPGIREVRRIGNLERLQLATAAVETYAAGTLVQGVALNDDDHIRMAAAAAGANQITLTTAAWATELSAGQQLVVGAGAQQETVLAQGFPSAGAVQLAQPLQFAKAANDPVVPLRALTAPVLAGANFITITNRRNMTEGDALRIGAAPAEEFVTIAQMPDRATAGADPGVVIFTTPVVRSYAQAGTPVARQRPIAATNVHATVLALDALRGAGAVFVSDGGAYPANSFIRLRTPQGTVHYHRVAAAGGALVPVMLTLNQELRRAHRPGAPVVERTALLDIQALDAGAWGNRLRVSVDDEERGLVTNATLSGVVTATRIRLSTVTGVEPGTLLELLAAAGPVGGLVKVTGVDRDSGELTLQAPGLTVPQQVLGLGIRSREFRLTVRLLQQPDPAQPTRNITVIDSEVFRWLSMDPRHSRYVQTVIGDIAAPLRVSDRRPEGNSWYVRVHDRAQDLPAGPPAAGPYRLPTLNSPRPGPEGLVDVLPDGRQQAARMRLEAVRGTDAIGTLTDAHYIGLDAADPEQRTGLFSLRNVEDISIVACPGRTTAAMQGALINHCELARYRFAVLDGPPPPQDTINDVVIQRQQYDTKYAALYHPWLLIPPPVTNGGGVTDEYAIPPSGHMLGVYARTDIERGVHKAPANEVVRGVTGLQRLLNKGEHDVLNPYPTNINVIRDFRANSRGIRVYGGRVITSDSDWKYVNVRRLTIFIEASINRGLQWVVFEPNADPLWARVRRSITNFLTLVWRNGALEGTRVEEAFFVKCDRTTMTQTDIDSGRLICVVGIAPVKPAEFVIVRIGLWTAHADE